MGKPSRNYSCNWSIYTWIEGQSANTRSKICLRKSNKFKMGEQPVWVHGDVSAGNILIKDKQLIAVIDFGCMAVGDPACDLVIAWTFFKNKSRSLFKSNVCVDDQTWQRDPGWALWKALITLERLEDKDASEGTK